MHEDNKIENEDLIINLTIDGTEYEDVEVKVTDPNKTIRGQINSIVSVFELPTVDQCGHPIQYLLGLIIEDGEKELEIFEFKDEDGREQTLLNYDIRTGDHLHLVSVPLYACPIPSEMEAEINEVPKDSFFEDEDFIINLTIDGTEYKDVEVKVTDLNRTIREQIERIISVFDLPKIDCGGNPIQYLLGQIIKDNDEPEILEFDDADGHEQTLINYNIIPGDTLYLISVPLAAYACPVPTEMEADIKRRAGKCMILYACPIPPDMQNYWDELYKDL